MPDCCGSGGLDGCAVCRGELWTSSPAVSTVKVQTAGSCRRNSSRAPLATVVMKRTWALLLVSLLLYVPFIYRQDILLAIGDRFGGRSRRRSGIPGRRLAVYGRAGDGHRTVERELAQLKATGRDLQSFPSVEDSTILFLHVFKCAGTSLREVLINWAKSEGWTGAVVEACKGNVDESNDHRICLNRENNLINMQRVKWLIRGQKLLAGHFLWDFRRYATEPYLMITTLRNPLELFVSAQQFKHRAETQTLESASLFVSNSMGARLRWADPMDIGFIRRFLNRRRADRYRPRDIYHRGKYNAMAETAVEHLNTVWVVGVVEQFDGFLEVLKNLLDPDSKQTSLWKTSRTVKDNGSPVASRDVVRNIDPALIAEFNTTALGLQWQVYGVALDLWDSRCREVLPTRSHKKLCAIPERQ